MFLKVKTVICKAVEIFIELKELVCIYNIVYRLLIFLKMWHFTLFGQIIFIKVCVHQIN